jgi:hypothetical protein
MAKPTKSRKHIFLEDNLREHIERRLPKTERTLAAEIRFLIRRGLVEVDDPMPEAVDEKR